jgi:hypothetical protein
MFGYPETLVPQAFSQFSGSDGFFNSLTGSASLPHDGLVEYA